MNLLEAYMKDEVFVDFGSEPMYGSDQAYINYPIRFATVTFQLMATNGLSQIADRIRKDMGMRPMHPMDEFTDDTCDNEGWYDFYYGVNLFTENHSDTCISFVVVNSDSPDNEAIYKQASQKGNRPKQNCCPAKGTKREASANDETASEVANG